MSAGAFLVAVNGQIEYLDVMAPAGTRWHCKYEFVNGPDWKIVGGIEAGLSQTANVINNADLVVFNLPIDITYKSTNPYGWPQIVISVYNGMQLQGYGRLHVPLQPGLHNLKMNFAKPMPSTWLGFVGTFFGYQPELVQPKMLATTAGNNLLRMVSSGFGIITMNVITQNLGKMGYDVGCIAL